ncbi:MAG: tyrosine phosphatase family protein [Alphaproteobacteria bacterium]
MENLRVTICGIPELDEHSEAGVTHILSILGPDWPDPPAFASFPPHRRLTLRFHDIIDPAPGQLGPSREDVVRILEFGRGVKEPARSHVLIHCHAGVSRSTAAATLILAQAYPDRPAEEVLERVAQIRPRAWPNLRILELGDALLGRDGEIVAAASAIYRRMLDREPLFGEAMIDAGRGREVRAALGSPVNLSGRSPGRPGR